eukprot:scaffold61328_cov26-Tisochrysis_lutea.AAC.6
MSFSVGACAAHVCYLLAEAPISLRAPSSGSAKVADSAPESPRFVLLGFDEHSSDSGFPTLAAIQATELYAACRQSIDPEFDSSGLYQYLLLYAHVLFDTGHHAQVRKYGCACRWRCPLSPFLRCQLGPWLRY